MLQSRIEPVPPVLEGEILTAGLLRKSLVWLFLFAVIFLGFH